MNEPKKCSKCGREMAKGSEQTLNDAFRCTRGGTEGPERLERYDFRIQPYCCENCGYIEFYKEMKENKDSERVLNQWLKRCVVGRAGLAPKRVQVQITQRV